MPRLFVAIELPDAVKQKILDICRGVERVKWVKKNALHLTLKFIGEVDDEVFARTKKILSQARTPAFNLKVSGLGYFGKHGRARVIWVGFENNEGLIELQRTIDALLDQNNIARADSRPFSPHITLARLNNMPVRKLQNFLEQYKEFAIEPFAVSEFHLFSSALKPEGAIHTIEQTYLL